MEIRCKLVLHRDSDNSYPDTMAITGDEEFIEMELNNPYRVLRVKKEELQKVISLY